MKRLLVLTCVTAGIAGAVWGAGGTPAAALPVAAAKTCSAGYVHANLSWGEKCLRVGQYCKIKGDREYHRYRFHCHTGRLSRSAAGQPEWFRLPVRLLALPATGRGPQLQRHP